MQNSKGTRRDMKHQGLTQPCEPSVCRRLARLHLQQQRERLWQEAACQGRGAFSRAMALG
jgi:hypothetical protein